MTVMNVRMRCWTVSVYQSVLYSCTWRRGAGSVVTVMITALEMVHYMRALDRVQMYEKEGVAHVT